MRDDRQPEEIEAARFMIAVFFLGLILGYALGIFTAP
jgi:hypothetical protein